MSGMLFTTRPGGQPVFGSGDETESVRCIVKYTRFRGWSAPKKLGLETGFD